MEKIICSGKDNQKWKNLLDLGEICLRQGKYDDALDLFRKSLLLNENSNTYKNIGWAFFYSNQFYESIEAFEKSLLLEQKSSTFKDLGLILLHIKAYDASIVAFKNSLDIQKNWNAYKGLGWALYFTEDYDGACDAFYECTLLHEHWNAYIGLGMGLFSLNRYSKSITAFKKSLSLRKYWNTYHYLGLCYLMTNENSLAVNVFNKALSLNQNWSTYKYLGQSLSQLDLYCESVDAYRRSISLREHWRTLNDLGFALIKTGEYKDAVAAFQRSIALNDNSKSYLGLGSSYLKMHCYSEAVIALNKSLSLEESWRTYRYLGYSFYATNNYRLALYAVTNWSLIKYSEEINHFIYQILTSGPQGIGTEYFSQFVSKNISNSHESAYNFLIKYINNGIVHSSIDPLLLRYASVLTCLNDHSEFPVERDDVLVEAISDYQIQDANELSNISKLHKYVFGVSHSRLHRSSLNTTVIDCCAGTMFSIGDTNSRAQHCQTITSEVKNLIPGECVLVFEFGEVDIRNHIFKISSKHRKSPYSVADVSVSRYMAFLESLYVQGFVIVVVGPHCGGGQVFSRATRVERNDLCAYVNDKLYSECSRRGFYFCTIFDKVVDLKSLLEIPGLYSDHNHLHLPPSKIGKALNALMSNRIHAALTSDVPCAACHTEQVTSECKIVISTIPGWDTGSEFYPSEDLKSDDDVCFNGIYLALIELPFLIHPKCITLKFKQSLIDIKTSVQVVCESWNVADHVESGNVYSSRFQRSIEDDSMSLVCHDFSRVTPNSFKSRFVLVRISASNCFNSMSSIAISRWDSSSAINA